MPTNNADKRPEICSDDTMKILIATDIHLGYDYKKKRGEESEDSFNTFEEILQYGCEREVDFILLGGDLFHDGKPTQSAIIKCMELLRKYCLGSREIKVQFLSDPEVIFRHCANKTVNYEDPNFNISMPIFSIHGNHDDPNFRAIGSMDLLSASGLINYFGKWTDLTRIHISPLILKKGDTHVALYGLSYINDQRLYRLIRDYKLDMLRPTEIPDCFNIFVLHQNRAIHSDSSYVPESKLPSFLNLIIWGHEHECRITPEFISEPDYFVIQPGSSIATSLCEGEAKPKHVGILSVNKKKFKLEELILKTVRPFVFDNLILHGKDLQENYTKSLSDTVYDFVDDYIENTLMPKAAQLLTGHPKQPIQPLLRLRVFYSSDEEIFDTIKLAQKYCDEVANPMEMVIFRKEKSSTKKSETSSSNLQDDVDDVAQALSSGGDENTDWCTKVQEEIKKKIDQNEESIEVLSVNGLNEALNRFIHRNDIDAFTDILKHQMTKIKNYLQKQNVENHSIENIDREIESFREKRIAHDRWDAEDILMQNSCITKQTQKLFDNTERRATTSATDFDQNYSTNDDDPRNYAEKDETTKTTGQGRGGRKSGRGRTGSKTSGINPLDTTVTSNSCKRSRQTTKKDQYTLMKFMRSSSQSKNDHDNFIMDDSD